MYTIRNLTHLSVKLDDGTTIAPGESIEYSGTLTPEMRRQAQLDVIHISTVAAATATGKRANLASMKARHAAFLNSTTAPTKSTKKK